MLKHLPALFKLNKLYYCTYNKDTSQASISVNVHLSWYNKLMEKRGRPPKENTLDQYLEIRIGSLEKQSFKDAAEFAGIPLSAWARERLRRAALRELQEASLPIAFMENWRK